MWPILARETLEGHTLGKGPCWQVKFSKQEKTNAPGCGQGQNPSARTPRTRKKSHQVQTPHKVSGGGEKCRTPARLEVGGGVHSPSHSHQLSKHPPHSGH